MTFEEEVARERRRIASEGVDEAAARIVKERRAWQAVALAKVRRQMMAAETLTAPFRD
jgi:hypothetical protein